TNHQPPTTNHQPPTTNHRSQTPALTPPVRRANLDHHLQNVVPRLRCFQHGVREHAAVPADVFDAALLGFVEPIARAFHDVELAAWVVGRAVAARLVVAAGAVDAAVVLGDVEVDRPGSQGGGYLPVG